jgi:class 3 adenylate cyclase
MNAVFNFTRIFLVLGIALLSSNGHTQPVYPFNIEPVITDFGLPKKLKNQRFTDLTFDHEGRLFLVSQNLIAVFNGSSWNYIYFQSTPLLAFDPAGKAWIIHENEIGILESDSLPTLRFSPLRPSGIEQAPPLTEVKQFISSHDKLLLNFGKSIFMLQNGGLQKINQNFRDVEIYALKNQTLLADSASWYTLTEGITRTTDFLALGADLAFFDHPNGTLCYNPASSQLIVFDRNNENPVKWDQPLQGIRSGIFIEELKAYCFFLASGKIVLRDANGTILSVSDAKTVLSDEPILKTLRSEYGYVWVLQERSLSRITSPSDYQRLTIPGDIQRINDFSFQNAAIYIGSSQGLFEFTGNRVERISNEAVQKMLETPAGLCYLTNNKVSLLTENHSLKSFGLQGLDMTRDQKSNALLVRTVNEYYLFQTDPNELTNPAIIPAPDNAGVFCIDNKIIYQVTQRELVLISAETQMREILPLPAGLNGLDLIKILQHNGKILLLCPEQIFELSDKTIVPLDWPEKDPVYPEFIDLISAGNSLAVLRKDPDGGADLLIKSGSAQIIRKLNAPLPANNFYPQVKILGDSICLYSAGHQIYVSRLKGAEYHKTYTAIINSIFTEKQNSAGCIKNQRSFLPGKDQIRRFPLTQNNLRIKASPTDYTLSDYRYQYTLVGRDSSWSEWSKGHEISISGLKQGEFLLKIRFLNSEGVISRPAKLTFMVQPSLYTSWWAFILYLISLLIIFFILYKSYLYRKHRPLIPENPEYSNKPGGVPPVQEEYQHYLDEGPVPEQEPGRQSKWDKYEMTTVLFSDIQGFTKIAEMMNPELLIDELDKFFFHFDSVVEKYNIEKIKTIGDAYMAAGGIPRKNSTNPIEVVLAALEMQQYMKHLKKSKTDIWDLRIGIHSGPVIAGIIGHKKRSYDIWGDTVNTASRMESSGEAGKVNISGVTYMLVKDYFLCEYRGKLPVKYKGNIDMYFVKGLRPELSINLGTMPNRRFFLKLQLLRLQDLEHNIFPMLEQQLQESAAFHNPEYAKHLYHHAGILGMAENLDMEEALLVRTAAILMFTGRIHTFRNFENKSAEIAGEILPEYQYSQKQVQEIKTLLLSSKLPMEPRNHLERIMCDLKMEYLGRVDYPDLIRRLYKEMSTNLDNFDPTDWKNEQLQILNNFAYYTPGARRLREIPPEEQMQRFNTLDW